MTSFRRDEQAIRIEILNHTGLLHEYHKPKIETLRNLNNINIFKLVLQEASRDRKLIDKHHQEQTLINDKIQVTLKTRMKVQDELNWNN